MERPIYQGRTSLIKYWYLVGPGGLLLAAGIQLINSPGAEDKAPYFMLPGLVLLGVVVLNTMSTTYAVTSLRVTERKGLLSPRTSEIGITDIRSVQVSQTPSERLFGIGDVAIARMGGRVGGEIVFAGIRKPHEVADGIPGQRRRRPERGDGPRLV